MTDQTEILMYGAQWCGDCRRAKQFLDKHKIAYKWIDLEQNPDETATVLKYNGGKQVIPTILFPDGAVLIEPTNAQLAEKLNISL